MNLLATLVCAMALCSCGGRVAVDPGPSGGGDPGGVSSSSSAGGGACTPSNVEWCCPPVYFDGKLYALECPDGQQPDGCAPRSHGNKTIFCCVPIDVDPAPGSCAESPLLNVLCSCYEPSTGHVCNGAEPPPGCFGGGKGFYCCP